MCSKWQPAKSPEQNLHLSQRYLFHAFTQITVTDKSPEYFCNTKGHGTKIPEIFFQTYPQKNCFQQYAYKPTGTFLF